MTEDERESIRDQHRKVTCYPGGATHLTTESEYGEKTLCGVKWWYHCDMGTDHYCQKCQLALGKKLYPEERKNLPKKKKSPLKSIFGNILKVLERICEEDESSVSETDIVLQEGKDFMIEETLKTKSGKRILNLRIVPCLENGEKSRYPIRGQVVIREFPKTRIKNIIWNLDGRSFYGIETGFDLDEATVTEILKGVHK